MSGGDEPTAAATAPPGDVRLRPMTLADVDAVLPYEQGMFGAEAWSRASYRAELADRRARSYVFAEDPTGAALGWAGVLVIGETAEILTVGVVPAARRAGLGRRLLGALLDLARQRGCVEVFLEVREDNAAARTLYESAGFAAVGVRRGYYDGGRVDAVTMRREIPR
ncbi:ribosomal protein S18-alanine N-acetyltransferase [uncultured Jatrophihabitans sp.]|uniref:ribosomal protein S18-alanine N-acetyltransferase n=1 Tax=uncultured Jatrophihabitans sp. TaxID=1610747 RepID=UPI0035CA3B5C